MVDFFAATLVPLGSPLTSALVSTAACWAWSSQPCSTSLHSASPAAAPPPRRRVRVPPERRAGFYFLLGDIQHSGLAALVHLPREYTLNRDMNFQWLNPVLAYLVPQRSTCSGSA